MDPFAFWVYLGKFLLAFIPLGLIPVMIFLERKGAAVIQDRPGPNRAAIDLGFVKLRGFGMVHNFSDVVKLVFKEDFIPARAHKWFYLLAPVIPVATAVLTPALIPWFGAFVYDTGSGIGRISGAILDVNSSLLLLFALGALSVYGVVLGSWGSNSKYSLLGGLRASAMMISYEVSMGLSILGLALIVGSFSLSEIVEWQAAHTWGLVAQPVGFLLFLVSMFAETNRTPFDVAEGESEIVGGFHTEYSSIKFALFFMGEYCHIVVASALLATVFCGGWDIAPWPGTGTAFVQAHLGWVLGALLLGKAIVLTGITLLIRKQKRRYAGFAAKDQADKQREYGLMSALFGLGALAVLGGAVACVLLINDPTPLGTVTTQAQLAAIGVSGDAVAVYPAWVSLLAAAAQIGIVVLKTLFFCWLFIWVRWTVPRLRYDQIMGLGWKVLLNIALVNLVITAVVAKLVQS